MTAANVEQQLYNAEQIQVLEGLEPLGKGPVCILEQQDTGVFII